MTLRILGMAALMALFTGTASTSAFASEEEGDAVVASESSVAEVSPSDHRAPPRWEQPRRAGFLCYARNITGQTFAARGNWRTPPRYVQNMAVRQCQYNSGFFRFSCRAIGCRRW